MEILHVEKSFGVNLEPFVIRVFDEITNKTVSIGLELLDNGEQREINIRRDKHPANSDLQELIKRAKRTVQSITILRREENSSNTTDIISGKL